MKLRLKLALFLAVLYALLGAAIANAASWGVQSREVWGRTSGDSLVVLRLNSDGTLSSSVAYYATKVTVSGDVTYVAMAVPGTAQASALWQAKRITVSGNDTVVEYADGDDSFDNVATDLSALSYE